MVYVLAFSLLSKRVACRKAREGGKKIGRVVRVRERESLEPGC